MNYKLFIIKFGLLFVGFFTYSSSFDAPARNSLSSSVQNTLPDGLMNKSKNQPEMRTSKELQQTTIVASNNDIESNQQVLQDSQKDLKAKIIQLESERNNLIETLDELRNILKKQEQHNNSLNSTLKSYKSENKKLAHMLQNIDADYSDDFTKVHAIIKKKYANEQLDQQVRYRRNIILATALTATCTWGICKFTSSVDSVSNLFGAITQRIFGSK